MARPQSIHQINSSKGKIDWPIHGLTGLIEKGAIHSQHFFVSVALYFSAFVEKPLLLLDRKADDSGVEMLT